MAQHKIIAVDKERGALLVRFYDENLPAGFLVTIDLPLERGVVVPLKGQDLGNYIRGFCPEAEFTRAAAQKEAGEEKPDLAYLDALVQPDHVVPDTPVPSPQPEPPLPGELEARRIVDL